MLRIFSGVCVCVSINGEKEGDVGEERTGGGGKRKNCHVGLSPFCRNKRKVAK